MEPTRTLILVEDHALVRELYADAMRRAGYRVIERPTAVELVELVAKNQPHAVVLDISLPGESGLSACQRLKADPRTSHVKVLLFTAHASLEMARAAGDAGADQFLVKPIAPVELFAAIERRRPTALHPPPQ